MAPTAMSLLRGKVVKPMSSTKSVMFAAQLRNVFIQQYQPTRNPTRGPKALRAVGQYLKERDGQVSAFYLSNVEQYLGREGIWGQFCANAATLPLDDTSTFIRSVRNGNFVPGVGLDSELGSMTGETKSCALTGAAGWVEGLGAIFGSPAQMRPPVRGRR